MEMRFWLSIIIPAIFLIPAIILHFVKKGLIEKALVKYQQYEDGEIEEDTTHYIDDETVGREYVHVSYDSIEEAESVFGRKYKNMVIALATLGILAFGFLQYSYLDFKKNLVFEGRTEGTFDIAEGAEIPRTRFSFDISDKQLECDLMVAFNDNLKDFYAASIFVQIYDPVDSVIVFEMQKSMEGVEDGDDNIVFSTIDTTVVFIEPGAYVLDYYAETTDIPNGNMYLKANASLFE
jgi:hypothetical protein